MEITQGNLEAVFVGLKGTFNEAVQSTEAEQINSMVDPIEVTGPIDPTTGAPVSSAPPPASGQREQPPPPAPDDGAPPPKNDEDSDPAGGQQDPPK